MFVIIYQIVKVTHFYWIISARFKHLFFRHTGVYEVLCMEKIKVFYIRNCANIGKIIILHERYSEKRKEKSYRHVPHGIAVLFLASTLGIFTFTNCQF